jgi:hypothetical protein
MEGPERFGDLATDLGSPAPVSTTVPSSLSGVVRWRPQHRQQRPPQFRADRDEELKRDVAPAKAGTSTPFDGSGNVDRLRLCRINEGLWLWVPAFAGTTLLPDGQITSRRMP